MGETEGEKPIHTSVAPKFVILIARRQSLRTLIRVGLRSRSLARFARSRRLSSCVF